MNTATSTDVPAPRTDLAPLPDLADDYWDHHVADLAAVGVWAVVRQLPAIVAESVRLAWQADRRDTLAAIGLNILAGLMTTLGLLATSGVLQQLFATGPTPDRIRAALPALIAAGSAVTARGGLGIAAGWAQARLAPQINYLVEMRLFEATSLVELAAFDDAGYTEEMNRARDRGMTEAAQIVNSTVDLATGLTGVTATTAAVAVIAPLLVPFVVLASIPAAVMAVRMARRQYLSMLAHTNRRRRRWMIGGLMANRYTATEIRTYQMRDALLSEYRATMSAETRTELRLVGAQTRTRLVGTSAGGLASLGLYLVLWSLLTKAQIPLAAAATALIALQTAHLGLNNAIIASNTLYESALYWSDYRTFIDRTRARTRPPGGQTVDPFDEITLTDVSLTYPDSDTRAVDGVSMTLRRGQVIALVGENGSGKSSLAKVIAGLYQPTGGVVAWNGTDTRLLDADGITAQIGVLSQDYWKFPFTAGRNITLGRAGHPATSESVEAAATASTAHDVITALPRGYDTLLSREFRDGHDLSGGQWQKLVAARGLYRDPAVFICDEPSAALDARAEHTLFQHLRRRPDRTVILITHRLANVRHADHIYVLDQGRIVADGDHDTLIAAGGLYAELWHLQASGYTAATE